MAHSPYAVKIGRLMDKEDAFVVCGNNALKRGVIPSFHDSTTAGHPESQKPLALMKPYLTGGQT